MSTQRYSPNTEFVWQDQPYQVTRILPANLIEIENMFNGQTKLVSFQDLYQALVDGQIEFGLSVFHGITQLSNLLISIALVKLASNISENRFMNRPA